jgi:FdhD protein
VKQAPIKGVRLEGERSTPVDESLCVEAPLQIAINDRSFTVTMRTPGDDEPLVRGLLHTEGVIRSDAPFYDIAFSEDDRFPGTLRAAISMPPVFVCENLLERRSLIAQASCGLCGKESLDDLVPGLEPVPEGAPLDVGRLPSLVERMQAEQIVFKDTGGCHAASAFSPQGDCLGVFEDIGRHNAVDKLVGHLLMTGRVQDAQLVLVSGRISFEIVIKVCRVGIPILAGVSALSSLAVLVAEQQGQTVIGFCRGDRATVYSHPGRIRCGDRQHAV